jgi:DNA-binding response OmpR family regulator
MAHGADIVVTHLGLVRREARQVLEALRTRYPATPVVAIVTPEDDHADGHWLLDGCDLLVSPVDPEQLVASVQGALMTRRAEVSAG